MNEIKTTSQKKRRLSERQRTLLISWACFMLIGALLGGAACSLVKGERAAVEPLPLYGTRDGRVITAEMSMDWGGEFEGEFVPIDCVLSEELQEFTFYLCKGYYIDFPFAMAVMFRESSFNAAAVSEDGRDVGLFQIRDVNAERLKETIGVTDLCDPYQNIRAGLYILRCLFEIYDDPAPVLMAYNMGEGGASVLWEQGVWETVFTCRVLQTAEEYRAQIEETKK